MGIGLDIWALWTENCYFLVSLMTRFDQVGFANNCFNLFTVTNWGQLN